MGRLTENQIMGLYAQFTREGARLLHEETPSVRGIGYRLFVSYVTVYLRSGGTTIGQLREIPSAITFSLWEKKPHH